MKAPEQIEYDRALKAWTTCKEMVEFEWRQELERDGSCDAHEYEVLIAPIRERFNWHRFKARYIQARNSIIAWTSRDLPRLLQERKRYELWLLVSEMDIRTMPPEHQDKLLSTVIKIDL